MMDDAAHALAGSLKDLGEGYLVVVSGAGVSLASGIPTFRGSDPDAVWHRDVTELGTFRYFREDPVGSWRWYMERFDRVLDKQPNPAHFALAAIERWHVERGGRFVLITQNVDPLHERAGSERLVKVHGSADRVRCTTSGCVNAAPAGSMRRAEVDMHRFEADPSALTLPRCPVCDGLLRQHVLWFDECYDDHHDYQWQRVQGAAAGMDFALFVGTSFAVGVTDMLLQSGLHRAVPLRAIDPGAEAPPHPDVRLLREPAERLLPEVCARLGITIDAGGDGAG